MIAYKTACDCLANTIADFGVDMRETEINLDKNLSFAYNILILWKGGFMKKVLATVGSVVWWIALFWANGSSFERGQDLALLFTLATVWAGFIWVSPFWDTKK